MSAEENSIFDEINEELKHDEILKFLKKHQSIVSWTIILIIIGIVGYSAWYSDKKKRLEVATTSLYDELYSSAMMSGIEDKKSKASLENLVQNAPSELVPLISLIKVGREIGTTTDVENAAKQLLELSEKKGVDIVWRDLAVLMYVSYRLEPEDKLLGRLEKLAEENRPFRFTAMEKIAMIYANKREDDKAISFLMKIVDDREAPDTLKKRITKLLNYIKNHKDDSERFVEDGSKEKNKTSQGEKGKNNFVKSKSGKSAKVSKKRKQVRR